MKTVIPFDKLYVSDLNVRKTAPDFDIAPLADSIRAHGLIEDLVVVDEGKAGGRLGIVAGGRRFRALKLLDAGARWPGDKLDRDSLTVELRPLEEAREISLAENTHTVAMNPADEVEAYGEILRDYEKLQVVNPVGRLARHFGKTVRYVEQRLRLADLAEDILVALRAGAIGVDVAKAYASVPDHGLQLEAFAAQERQGRHSIDSIRAVLAGRTYRPSDRWVCYVGIDAYVKAGGRVGSDLFMGGAENEVLLDTALLDRLLLQKAEPEAERLGRERGFAGGGLEGWGPDSHVPPRAPAGYVFAPGTAARLPAEERADALLVCRVARDGSRLEPSEHVFRIARPAAAPGPGAAPAAGTVARLGLVRDAADARPPLDPLPTTGQFEAQRRRREVEARALRMVLPAFAGTPFEGRAFWPPDPVTPVPPIGRDPDGNYLVVVQLVIPKAEVDAKLDEADWQLTEEETAPKAAAPAEPAAPAEATPASAEEKPTTAEEFAAFIEKRLEAQPEVDGRGGNFKEHHDFARNLVGELVEQHGARYRDTGHDHHLTLAGVSRSCTSGASALLSAWVSKVRAAAQTAPAELESAL